MTIETINENSLSELTENDNIYMSPDDWGNTYYGTMDDWKELIDLDSGFGSDWHKHLKNSAIQEGTEAISKKDYLEQLLNELEEIYL